MSEENYEVKGFNSVEGDAMELVIAWEPHAEDGMIAGIGITGADDTVTFSKETLTELRDTINHILEVNQ